MNNSFPARNVLLRDFEGTTLSGFWQYGFVNWETFYTWLQPVIFATESWAIFDWNEADGNRGQIKVADTSLVDPGLYVLLQIDGTPIKVGLVAQRARARHPTRSNTATGTAQYRARVRARDPACLISGLPVVGGDYTRLKAAHIFPRAYDVDWIGAGYPSRITDPAPLAHVGGPSKIDSIQNVILLRSDLRDAWDSYDFGVNPDAGYIVTPFVGGYDDIAGKTLRLDHISDIDLRPLDDLFRDHLLQGIFKNMKGAGEPQWDYEDTLGDGAFDLSRTDVWNTEEGKDHLEFELRHRLHSLEMQQV